MYFVNTLDARWWRPDVCVYVYVCRASNFFFFFCFFLFDVGRDQVAPTNACDALCVVEKKKVVDL